MTDDPCPLQGVRVLDMSRVLAGPYGTMLLADMGADVIKIEPPWGDDTRHWGPPWQGGESAYFLSVNRGKRSVVLDLSTADGRDALLAMVEDSDVMVENFRTGQMDRWGLGYEDVLRRRNAGLVYASISGYGRTGPAAQLPGYATLVDAMGGLMSITGDPDGEPMKVGVALVDVITGCHLVGAVTAALLERSRSGKGRRLDLSLLESNLSALVNQAGNYFTTGENPARHGNAHPNIVPYQLFHTADRPVMVAVGNDGQFRHFAEFVGHAEWANDSRFAHNSDRVSNRNILVPMIEEVLRVRTADSWLAEAWKEGIPVAPVNTISDAFSNPQVLHLDVVVTDQRPSGEIIPTVRHPVSFDHVAPQACRPPPLLGEHTDELLSALGRRVPTDAASKESSR